MKFRPLEDRIVVHPDEPEEKTSGGIVIPDMAQERPQEGEVLAVGPGGWSPKGERIPLDLKVGDKVMYSKYGGTEITDTDDGEAYLILAARDVLAVVE